MPTSKGLLNSHHIQAASGLPSASEAQPLRWTQATDERKGVAAGSQTDRAALTTPLVVIVPVYNASSDLGLLVRSLQASVEEPVHGLTLLFCDDASSDTGTTEMLKSHEFFRRDDVVVCERPHNQGFVKNVNAAFAFASSLSPDADFLVLNSDTRVFPGLFTTLQRAAYSRSRVASVTPVTNNGTIVSIFGWPHGCAIPACFTPEQVAEAVSRLKLDLIDCTVPTGIGYCMYLRREAFDVVGPFNEVFGQGYGEECDWCCRASQRGFENILTTRAFVYHAGGRSFGETRKEEGTRTNASVLASRHPAYDADVADYIARDPLKFHRIAIVLDVLAHVSGLNEVHLLTLHSDPDAVSVGGTEAHVRHLRRMLLEEGQAVLVLAPRDATTFVLRGMVAADVFLEETVHETSLPDLILLLERYVSRLHVHHTINWPRPILDLLATSAIKVKSVTAHDFWFLCPSINLLGGRHRRDFCAVEEDGEKCDACLKANWPLTGTTIHGYRAATLWFLHHFDTILVPSPSVTPYFARAYGSRWKLIMDRVKVLPHDLGYIGAAPAQIDRAQACGMAGNDGAAAARKAPVRHPSRSELICVIGAIGENKGFHLLFEALPLLRSEGFDVMILGMISSNYHKNMAQVRITPYGSIEELALLLALHRPDYTCYPSIWPETFCYAFFEGLFLYPAAVPIVGPYGNPARLCEENGIGPVMTDTAPEGLLRAALLARRLKKHYLRSIDTFLPELRRAAADRSYLQDYLSSIAGADSGATSDAWSAQVVSMLLTRASERDSLLSRQETVRIGRRPIGPLALRLRSFARAHPRLKATLLPLRDAWRNSRSA